MFDKCIYNKENNKDYVAFISPCIPPYGNIIFHDDSLIKSFKFCPYCGKKIEVKE